MKEEWYYLDGRERLGPVSETEIRKRLVAKLLKPTDMVWKEGMDGWTRANETEEFCHGGRRPHRGEHGDGFQIRADLGVPVVSFLLGALEKVFGGGFYRRSTGLFVNLGHVAVLVSMVFVLFMSLRTTINGDFGFRGITGGILIVLGLLVAQFLASRFLKVGEAAIEDNSSTVTCRPVLDAMAALGLLGAVFFVASGVVGLISAGFSSVVGYQLLAVSLTMGAFCLGIACLGLNPGVANTEVSTHHRDAGEEALGLVAFFSKGLLALAPIVYGFGSLVFAVSIGILAVGERGETVSLMREGGAIAGLFEVMLAPLIFYLLFLLGWLAIRIVSATLALPGKVDRVAMALDAPESESNGEGKKEEDRGTENVDQDGGDGERDVDQVS